MNSANSEQERSFADAAAGSRRGFLGELWDFMRSNKKWWLAPIVIAVVGLGALVLLSGSAVAPFIYTLF